LGFALLIFRQVFRLALRGPEGAYRRDRPSAGSPLFRNLATLFEVTPLDITKGAMPFIGVQAVALALVYIFPGLALWLPAAIGW
jgi:TRAP-type mannitol/chloroaromatic compound transport system permease large subunit